MDAIQNNNRSCFLDDWMLPPTHESRHKSYTILFIYSSTIWYTPTSIWCLVFKLEVSQPFVDAWPTSQFHTCQSLSGLTCLSLETLTPELNHKYSDVYIAFYLSLERANNNTINFNCKIMLKQSSIQKSVCRCVTSSSLESNQGAVSCYLGSVRSKCHKLQTCNVHEMSWSTKLPLSVPTRYRNTTGGFSWKWKCFILWDSKFFET